MKKLLFISILGCAACGKISNDFDPSARVVVQEPEKNEGEAVAELSLAEVQDFTVVKNDSEVKKFSEIFKKSYFVMALIDHECEGCEISSAIKKYSVDDIRDALESDRCDFGAMMSRNALRKLAKFSSAENVLGIHLSVNTIAKRYNQKNVDQFAIYVLDRNGKVSVAAKATDLKEIAKVCQ